MPRIRRKIGSAGIDDTASALHQCRQAARRAIAARAVNDKPQPLLDQILELAAVQRCERFGFAVKIVRQFDGRFHLASPKNRKTIFMGNCPKTQLDTGRCRRLRMKRAPGIARYWRYMRNTPLPPTA